MICANCGNVLKDTAKFCDKCGKAVLNANGISTQQTGNMGGMPQQSMNHMGSMPQQSANPYNMGNTMQQPQYYDANMALMGQRKKTNAAVIVAIVLGVLLLLAIIFGLFAASRVTYYENKYGVIDELGNDIGDLLFGD